MNEARKLFGESIRGLRRGQGLSQEDLAKRMAELGFPFHQTTIYKMESGNRGTSVDELIALASIFDVSPRDLVHVSTRREDEREVDEAIRAVHETTTQINKIRNQIAELGRQLASLEPVHAERVKRLQELDGAPE